ncbi:MAG: hypothetical protein JWP37_2126 [Mucilaginibacter sp.]|nr:hypothetical protein [Mucilaginibacter sp.]
MKYFIFFLFIVGISGCSLVSKQYYYVPNASHHTIKDKDGYFKMVRSQIEISDTSGKNIGTVITSNGIGVPLLAGPPYLPVVPVGLVDIFYKRDHQFILDINIKCNTGHFMTLAIDSNDYKKVRDSLNTLRIATAARLNTNECYMIINGSKRIPLKAQEYFMGSTRGHSYRMYGDIRFSKVRTLTLVTGNPLLDNALKNINFKRKKRITYCVMGFS